MLWKSGMRMTPARLNDPSDKPMCRLVQFTAGTLMLNAANTAIDFDTEEYDTHGFHSTTNNPSWVVIPASAGDGIYLCRGLIIVPGRTDYQTLGAVIQRNGASQAPWERLGPNTNSAQRTVEAEARLNLVVGDRIQLVGLQANAAAASVTTPFGSSFESVLEVEKLRGPA